MFHPEWAFSGLLEGHGFFCRRRISCSGRVSPTPTLRAGGLSCEASCILRPARLMRPTRPWTNSASLLSGVSSGLAGPLEVMTKVQPHSGSPEERAFVTVQSGVPLYHPYPYPASRRPLMEGQRDNGGTAHGRREWHQPRADRRHARSLLALYLERPLECPPGDRRMDGAGDGAERAVGGAVRAALPGKGRNGRALKHPQDATWLGGGGGWWPRVGG